MPTTYNTKVFVPNKGSHDYTAAWDFGDLIFCTEGPVNRTDFLTMHSDLHKSMQNAQPDDFIMLSSLPSLCCIMCSIFASRFGRLNILIFEDGEYIARHLTLE